MESGKLDQALSLNNRVYFDSFLSPDYSTQQLKSAFGSAAYCLEKLGIWYAVFLFLKLITEIVVFLKAFEIHRLTGATVSFSKILLGAVFNLFVLSIFTSIFNRHGANDDEIKAGYIPVNRPLN